MANFLYKRFKLELTEEEKEELKQYSQWKKASAKSNMKFGPVEKEDIPKNKSLVIKNKSVYNKTNHKKVNKEANNASWRNLET